MTGELHDWEFRKDSRESIWYPEHTIECGNATTSQCVNVIVVRLLNNIYLMSDFHARFIKLMTMCRTHLASGSSVYVGLFLYNQTLEDI